MRTNTFINVIFGDNCWLYNFRATSLDDGARLNIMMQG